MSKIMERLALHASDFAVLYIKLHNYHWHVEGLEFKSIHELTESYYEKMTAFFDEAAERILQLGGKAPSSMKEYSAISGISEETGKSFKTADVLKKVTADFEYAVKELKTTRVAAAGEEDSTTDSILAGMIEYLEKEIWMLKSMQK